jgi:nucleotide-binding universal stress UspA family protein
MKRILVVANRTLGEQHLLDELHRRRALGPVVFHVVVPASHPFATWTWTDEEAELEASQRLDELLETLAVAGIGATGEIGDASPVTAVDDAVRRELVDEIIVSTLPQGLSRWLAGNVVHRIRDHTGLPVTHVVAERATLGV